MTLRSINQCIEYLNIKIIFTELIIPDEPEEEPYYDDANEGYNISHL